MNVIVLCEFSGVVRDAFIHAGHTAISCDLIPSESPGPHIQADCRTVNVSPYDLLIGHPPCTYLCSSGARWWKSRQPEQQEALEFVRWMMNLPVPRIAIENPIGRISSRIRPMDQIIQPWQFGHGETKSTCLWLKGLPLLRPSHIVDARVPRVHFVSPGPNRWKDRSRTYQGIAAAMASQWGVV